MKRLALLLVLLLPMSLLAQDTEDDDNETASKKSGIGLRLPTRLGHYMVGANVVLANARFQKGVDAAYNIGISPKIGVFILPNIALGMNFGLNIEGNQSVYTIGYAASPFARFYFAHDNGDRPARPLQFFTEIGVGFGGTNSHYETGTGTKSATSNGFRAYVLPGVDYFLNNRVAAELGLQYQYIGGKPDAHVIGLNLGFQIFLGRD
jgi:hypothetical protein